MTERITTPCPTCDRTTLFIGDGGGLTCAFLGCPQPVVEVAVRELRDENMRLRKWSVAVGDATVDLARTMVAIGVPIPGQAIQAVADLQQSVAVAKAAGEAVR